MVSIDCHELTFDEQLALAGAITEGLGGRAMALVKDEKIVLDNIAGETLAIHALESIVRRFVERRRDGSLYSIEIGEDEIIVHTPDPLARSWGRKDSGQVLPDNLLKCPFFGCGFVTPYQELYIVHVRAHAA